jgi:hypothetical protein
MRPKCLLKSLLRVAAELQSISKSLSTSFQSRRLPKKPKNLNKRKRKNESPTLLRAAPKRIRNLNLKKRKLTLTHPCPSTNDSVPWKKQVVK